MSVTAAAARAKYDKLYAEVIKQIIFYCHTRGETFGSRRGFNVVDGLVITDAEDRPQQVTEVLTGEAGGLRVTVAGSIRLRPPGVLTLRGLIKLLAAVEVAMSKLPGNQKQEPPDGQVD